MSEAIEIIVTFLTGCGAGASVGFTVGYHLGERDKREQIVDGLEKAIKNGDVIAWTRKDKR